MVSALELLSGAADRSGGLIGKLELLLAQELAGLVVAVVAVVETVRL